MMLLRYIYIYIYIKNIQDKLPDITSLATNTTLSDKTNELKAKYLVLLTQLLRLLLLMLK